MRPNANIDWWNVTEIWTSSVVAYIGFTDSSIALEKHVLLQLPQAALVWSTDEAVDWKCILYDI